MNMCPALGKKKVGVAAKELEMSGQVLSYRIEVGKAMTPFRG